MSSTINLNFYEVGEVHYEPILELKEVCSNPFNIGDKVYIKKIRSMPVEGSIELANSYHIVAIHKGVEAHCYHPYQAVINVDLMVVRDPD